MHSREEEAKDVSRVKELGGGLNGMAPCTPEASEGSCTCWLLASAHRPPLQCATSFGCKSLVVAELFVVVCIVGVREGRSVSRSDAWTYCCVAHVCVREGVTKMCLRIQISRLIQVITLIECCQVHSHLFEAQERRPGAASHKLEEQLQI
jgi:hypothetical protein